MINQISSLENLQVEYLNIEDLKAYEKNARTHSEEQIEQLCGSIREFGFTNPVLIDEKNELIAGHGRCTAAKKLGLKTVPAIRLKNLTEIQVKALRIADNQLALNAGWDTELLSAELATLQVEDFDMDLLGFSLDEIDSILNPEKEDPQPEEDKYTGKTEIPQYEVTGKQVELTECVDKNKSLTYIQDIDTAEDLTEEERQFLRLAATRLYVFDYKNIAEYYANSASPAMQRMMEKLALVIIDMDNAIANGYVKLSDELKGIIQEHDESE